MKYEICTMYPVPTAAGRRNTGLKLMSNTERRLKNEEMYNVPSTKYKVGIRIRTIILLFKNYDT